MTRNYGILLPVFSLPGGHGIGDFGKTAYDFVNRLSALKCSYWQILPLNQGSKENGYSPYFSTSAYAINPLFISLDMLRDDKLLTDDELSDLPKLQSEIIDYEKVRSLKMPLLSRAAHRFEQNSNYIGFCIENQHWLDDFALFEALRCSEKKFGLTGKFLFGIGISIQLNSYKLFMWKKYRNKRCFST